MVQKIAQKFDPCDTKLNKTLPSTLNKESLVAISSELYLHVEGVNYLGISREPFCFEINAPPHIALREDEGLGDHQKQSVTSLQSAFGGSQVSVLPQVVQ